jgi:nucleoside-diphosphate-sugar epimerase
MRVFVTGATGFIGSAVVKELVNARHEVVGLARSEESAKALAALGARAHRGSIEDMDSLRKGAAGSNAAIHLAFFHKLSHASLPTRIGILFGGRPSGIVSRFTRAAVEAERRAIEALADSLTGSDRALVVASPTMALPQGRLATEDDAPDTNAPGAGRAPSEWAALALASHGIRASVVRLPPAVHDREKQGFASRMIEIAKKKSVSAYVADGQNRWSAVHRLDAAHLFRLALEAGSAGARYHAAAEDGIPVREIAEIIGRRLNVPVVSKSPEEAAEHFSWLAPFLAADNPVSSQLTRERLEWHPAQAGLLSDLSGAEVFQTSRVPASGYPSPAER